MKRRRKTLRYRTMVVEFEGRTVECVTIAAVANAIGRSLVHTGRLIRDGMIPVPLVIGGETFPTKRNPFPLRYVDLI